MLSLFFIYFVIEFIVCLVCYLVCRFVEIGCNDIFIVLGDFNFILLDYLLNELGINNIGCCNEINVGYVVEGYVCWKGVGCVVVIFIVGGFSVINSIVGVYSENFFVICIVGGFNINDYGIN